ncbi:MAG TPA: VWA domain-containing protein, partial [Phycicoccus sp.]|nr:VWA domain-containing protein [Phycicoccus sp.]
TVYADLPVADVPPLRLRPRNSTALLDSLARLITEAGARLAALPERERPGTVVVAVMTDGMENASREWTHAAVKALIEQQTRDYGWEFTYMGADQDAIEVGMSVGISADSSITYARNRAGDAMALQSRKVRQYREAKRVDAAAPMPGWTAEERRDLA